VPADLQGPEDPESIRDAKKWLSEHMPRGNPYQETTDQSAMTAQFDLAAARRADSFDKCYREIYAMLEKVRTGDKPPASA